jgi:hypothetical protein
MKTKSFTANIVFVLFFSLMQITCKSDPPVVPPIDPPYSQTIFLSVADSGLTEVYLSLSMADTLPPRVFELFRNNNKILSGSLFGKETTLVDTTALLNTSYYYQAFRLENVTRKDSSNVVSTRTLDTTSHEFAWTEYTFGNWSPNVLRDIEIESDTKIIAVGTISTRDSSGNSTEYNVIKQENNTWKLQRFLSNAQILFPGSIGDDSIFAEGTTLRINSSNDIWLAAGNMHLLTQSSWKQERAEGAGFGSELWGDDKNSVWIVGALGTIIKYNGLTWQKQSSGTTVDLTDIWGTPDGSTVWACGYSSDNMRSVLLENKNGSWQTLWSREGVAQVSPYGYRVTTIWFKRNLYLCNSNAVFRLKNNVATQISPSFSWLIHCIRGNDENDIVVVTEESAIWHYNGNKWKKVFQNSNMRFESVGMRGNTIVAVGNDLSTFPGKAVIVVGKR